jgi:hypothetical protein
VLRRRQQRPMRCGLGAVGLARHSSLKHMLTIWPPTWTALLVKALRRALLDRRSGGDRAAEAGMSGGRS